MKEWKKNIRRVVPYVPGEQPKQTDVIKLNTNENPYPPSPKAVEAASQMKNLRKYPDPAAAKLTEAIASYHGLSRDQVFVGVGSDDVLAVAFMTFFNSDKPIFFPDITYSFYPVWAELFRIPYEKKALDQEFKIRPEDYAGENGGVVFPNPNAPTGILMPLDQIEEILKANPDVVVIVDEAYVDFAGPSAMELVDRYENLMVVQTFSKSRSMAGARLGFAIASKGIIEDLNKIKYSTNPYSVNRCALAAGVAAVRDSAYYEANCARIAAEREKFAAELRERGWYLTDSKANFVLARPPKGRAEDIAAALKERGILVRYLGGELADYLRITIGTPEQMQKLLAALETA